MTEPAQPSAWNAFVATLKNFETTKINSRWMAMRNAIAVALPLAIGELLGNALGAVAISTGALNVAYSDGRDPYRQRARRMLTWSILGALGVFVGCISGRYHVAAIPVTAIWAFVGGMCIATSSRAGDLGLNTLVMVIVFSARAALSPLYALETALLVLGGGLLQTTLALLFWPVHRYEPERRAVGSAYRTLADEIDPKPNTPALAALNPPTQQVQDTLAAISRDSDLEDARFRMLFDQADRIRISVFLLDRLRSELGGRDDDNSTGALAVACVDNLRSATANLIRHVAQCLALGQASSDDTQDLKAVEDAAAHARSMCGSHDVAGQELTSAVNSLVGQLRAVVRLTANVTPGGMEEMAAKEAAQPWRFQAASWIATLRANIDWRSPVFRHALRLAICVAGGDAIGRSINWQRSYWIPMTIAVVLKPDFSSTFSRGVLRLLGTFAGLAFATLLYHLFPAGPFLECILVFVFTYALRLLGPANYGIFSVAISGLIVFELAAAGTAPGVVVLLRAMNTALGGILALVAYTLWPTWERRNIGDVLAEMIDACRAYFDAVMERFAHDSETLQSDMDNKRREFRRIRSEAAASIGRALAEPGINPEKANALRSIQASSLSLFSAILAIEASVQPDTAHTTPEAFNKFANDVEFLLYHMAASLRGTAAGATTLPKLRDDHARMLESRDAFSSNDQFILNETDRLTTALNTLREQVTRYLS
jgi:uncharacterized membrane protein YccC